MDATTRAALLAINRRFYEQHAAAFSATRQRPWDGWQRALKAVSRQGGRALDVGCGNARFAACLALRPPRWQYLGIDNSPSLLDLAGERLRELISEEVEQRTILGWELEQAEASVISLELALGERSFDLITLFGLLHHLPGHAERRGLLSFLARRLGSGGTMIVSLWRFDRDPSWRRKHLQWESYNRGAVEPIDLPLLEPGDTLLTWSGDRQTPRYCHLADDDEADRLVAELCRAVPSLIEIDRFDADGRSGQDNHYLIMGRA